MRSPPASAAERQRRYRKHKAVGATLYVVPLPPDVVTDLKASGVVDAKALDDRYAGGEAIAGLLGSIGQAYALRRNGGAPRVVLQRAHDHEEQNDVEEHGRAGER